MKKSITAKTKDTGKLLSDIVNTDDDFEWYPTTTEIIECVKADLSNSFDYGYSLLDCGAGDGRVLKKLGNGRKYAIEKSKPLLNSLDRDIFVVGTEFKEQTLLDKNVDVIFSNPPYSEFEAWATKIIREAKSALIYLVIPERWQKSDSINQSIADRRGKFTVLGGFDFLNADRKARAKVQVIKIDIGYSAFRGKSSGDPLTDPFALWFEENFCIKAKDREHSSYSFTGTKSIKEEIESSLVKGGDIVKTLSNLYQKELDDLIQTFKKFEKMDGGLLKELDVSKEGICAALKLRITGLKDRYWSELFDRFEKVTSKLTQRSRQRMLDTLTQHTHVDFTVSNAYAIVVWVLKNANHYFDDQLIECVERLTEKANIINYGSNQKTFGNEEWRYNTKPRGLDRYKLDYRVVIEGIGGLCNAYYGYEKGPNNLSKSAHDFIQDLRTIATNLGFDCTGFESAKSYEWESNKRYKFNCKDVRANSEVLLFEAKAFKNGNLHIFFNQDFILRLNVEFGRLKGWLKDSRQASKELKVSLEIAVSSFNSNLQLHDASCLRLGLFV